MYTLKQASDKLGVSIVTLRRYIKQGKLKATLVGKEYRVSAEDVAELLVKPDTPESLQKKALETNDSFKWLFERAQAFEKAAEKFRDTGEDNLATELEKDALIFSFNLKPIARKANSENKWGRFTPRMIMKDAEGNDIPRPDPAWIDEKIVEHAKKRANGVKNPVTKAVYEDLVFEFSRNADKPTFGKRAVKTYLAAAEAELPDDDRLFNAQGHILRALEIALQLKDKQLFSAVVEYAMQKMRELVADNKMRITHEIIEELLKQANQLDTQTISNLNELIDKAVRFYVEQEKNEYIARSFMQMKNLLPSVKADTKEQKKVKRMVFESYLREADSKADSGMVAAHFLAEALKVGGGVMTQEEKALLRQRIEKNNLRAEGEMKSVSFDFTIKQEEIQQYIAAVLVDDMEKSLVRMALLKGMIPSVARAKESAEELMKEFPMSHLVSHSTLQDGRVVSITGGGLDLTEDHILKRLSQEIQVHGLFLGFLFDELKNRGLTAKKLAAYFSERDFFKNEALPAVSEGVELYFEGKYYSAINVLIPQIEQVLRLANRKLGRPTLRSLNSGEQRVIYLQEALVNLKDIMSEDMYQYFCLVLWDKRGPALRDTTAHGLLEYSSANRQQANLLMHLMLILAVFVFKPMDNDDGPDSK